MRRIIKILAITFFVSFSFAMPVLSESLNIKLHCNGEYSLRGMFGELRINQVDEILTIKDGHYSFSGTRSSSGGMVVLIGKGRIKMTSDEISLIDEESRAHILNRNSGRFLFSPHYFQGGSPIGIGSSLIKTNIICKKFEKLERQF